MVRSWINNNNKIEKSQSNYFTSNETANTYEKSITKLSGEGKWKGLHGVRFMVDNEDVIIKGPDEFVGRKWKDIKDLDYLDLFNVMRNVSRATTVMQKGMIFDPYGNFAPREYKPSELAEKYSEIARKDLDKAIDKKKQAAKHKDPLYKV